MSNKAFYFGLTNKNQNHLIDFSDFKTDLYRFRSGNYYFKSLEDHQRFRQNKKFDFKDNYKKNIKQIDTSIDILKNLNKRNRFRDGNGKIQSSDEHLPKSYYNDINKKLERRFKERDEEIVTKIKRNIDKF